MTEGTDGDIVLTVIVGHIAAGFLSFVGGIVIGILVLIHSTAMMGIIVGFVSAIIIFAVMSVFTYDVARVDERGGETND